MLIRSQCSLNMLKCFKPQKVILRTTVVAKVKNPRQQEQAVDEFKIEERPRPLVAAVAKKPQRAPFAKNLLMGKLDYDCLAYPEILKNDDLQNLEQYCNKLHAYVTNLPKTPVIERAVIKDFKLFAPKASAFDGGLEVNETAFLKIQEVVATNPSLSAMLNVHQNFGVRMFQKYGNNAQKEMYLQKLIDGDLIASFALMEQHSHDLLTLETTARFDIRHNAWALNGEKHWVVNGNNADILIVFAQTDKEHAERIEPSLSAFIVDKNKLEIDKIEMTSVNSAGVKGADLCRVKFNNLLVPSDCVIGRQGYAFKTALKLLESNRLFVGSECVSSLKKCMQKAINDVIEIKEPVLSPLNLQWSKHIIAEMTKTVYTIESMTYLTAGLLDQYENQDCDMESSIVKFYGVEITLRALRNLRKLCGCSSYSDSHYVNEAIRDIEFHEQFSESNKAIQINIALSGLQHCGQQLFEEVSKRRNPFFNPVFALKLILEDRRHLNDNPKLDLHLDHHLHPTLATISRNCEYCILRLKWVVNNLLTDYGLNIINEHAQIERLTDIVCRIYAMLAVLTRSSRSYCIGLRNADDELLIASKVCEDATSDVRQLVDLILNDKYIVTDEAQDKIGDRSFYSKKYFLEHPITRNW